MNTRLDDILHKHEDLSIMLADPEVTSNPKRYAQISRNFSELEPIAAQAKHYKDLEQQMKDNQELLADAECDAEFKAMAEEENRELKQAMLACESELTLLLLPKDP
ncbi:MAG: PCRF domain-containing protein, partial [Zetaproteobacteria bacterium]|nr:PCRF domain-containing protein [Zetaproteobacteria bacterium]